MTGPIHGDWASRPGWSEFGAWRAAGKHTGFDYYCPEGTPVYATATGVVTLAGWNGSTNGYQVTIRHDGGQAASFSCHLLADIRVKVGQSVTRDTVVGFVGHSGNAKDIYWKTEWHGATTDLRHVHHTVKADGRVVDPILFYGPAPAGGGTTPITQQEEEEMVHIYKGTEGAAFEWIAVVGGGVRDGCLQFAPADRGSFDNFVSVYNYGAAAVGGRQINKDADIVGVDNTGYNIVVANYLTVPAQNAPEQTAYPTAEQIAATVLDEQAKRLKE